MVQAYDGKSYSDLIEVWRVCLADPDFDTRGSVPHARLEELGKVLRDLYCTKVSMCCQRSHVRVFMARRARAALLQMGIKDIRLMPLAPLSPQPCVVGRSRRSRPAFRKLAPP